MLKLSPLIDFPSNNKQQKSTIALHKRQTNK